MVSSVLIVRMTNSVEIKTLQNGLQIAQELKKSTESVFVEVCYAVEISEAYADKKIIMSAIKKGSQVCAKAILACKGKGGRCQGQLKGGKE